MQVLCPKIEALKEKPPKSDHLLVSFYGDNSYDWLPKSKLEPLDCDAAIASTRAPAGATNKALQEALAQAIADAE